MFRINPRLHFFSIILTLSFLLAQNASSQLQGYTALLIGKLADKDGQPIPNIKFALNAESKKIRGKTGADGVFQQVVKPGVQYIIEWQHPNIILRRDTVDIPNPGQYFEHKVVFSPSAINIGDALGEGNIFARGAAEITSESELSSIATTLKTYPRIAAEITVSDDVPEIKPKKLTSKKTPVKPIKKAKKGPIVNELPTTAIISKSRSEAIAQYFEKKYPEIVRRVSIAIAPSSSQYALKAKVISILPEM